MSVTPDQNEMWETFRTPDRATTEPSLVVDVDGFEGPLDLLLALARTQKVDLTRISILALAEQYLAFIEKIRALRLELAADYLVMAAWLAYLKSRLLLPEEETDEPSGEEVWDEPMTQFKDMLLAGAYSDFVTDMTVLKHAMGPAGRGLIVTTTWHTPEPPAWVPYESSKAAKNRLVYALAHHLRDKGIACVAVAPGWMRTELMEASFAHDPGALDGRTETPHYAARAVVALAGDPDASRFTGRTMDVAVLAREYGFTDLDGTQPDLNAGRFEQGPG